MICNLNLVLPLARTSTFTLNFVIQLFFTFKITVKELEITVTEAQTVRGSKIKNVYYLTKIVYLHLLCLGPLP
jgi:hypothetical protein